MPSKRPEGTPDEEIEAWSMRMIADVEDLDYSLNRQDWLEFVNRKIYEESGVPATDAQLAALDTGRARVIGMFEDLGMSREQPFLTRETQVRYRDVETGRWTARSTLNVALGDIIPRGRR